MENQPILKWYQKPVTVILFLIFFFPVGLYLMWKHDLWNKTTRVIVSVFFGLLIIANMKNSSNEKAPQFGVYSCFVDETDIYCRKQTYIEIRKVDDNRIAEFYSKDSGGKACSTWGFYRIDDINNLTIYGLSNPNTFGAAEQFNGKYVWKKDDSDFGIYSFFKINSNIKLTNYEQ